jgi:hypothetical protein
LLAATIHQVVLGCACELADPYLEFPEGAYDCIHAAPVRQPGRMKAFELFKIGVNIHRSIGAFFSAQYGTSAIR